VTFLPAHEDDQRTRGIIGCAIQVHKELGPGLLEAPYQAALCIAMLAEGIAFEREKAFPIMFRGVRIADYRPDLVVNNEVVVEIKSVERFDPVFMSQMLTYLTITGLKVGLIINFNRPRLLDGVKRISL
jgi:GxxExxY protein